MPFTDKKPLPVSLDVQESLPMEEKESKGTAGVATKAIAFGIVNVVLGVVGGWYLCMDTNKDTFAELRSMQLYAEKSGCGARDVSGGFYWKPVQASQPVSVALPTEANNFSALKLGRH